MGLKVDRQNIFSMKYLEYLSEFQALDILSPSSKYPLYVDSRLHIVITKLGLSVHS